MSLPSGLPSALPSRRPSSQPSCSPSAQPSSLPTQSLSYQELSRVLRGRSINSVTDSIRLALRQALAQLLGIDLSYVGQPVFTSVIVAAAAAATEQHERSLGQQASSAVQATTLVVASGSFLSSKADPSPSSAVASTVAGNTAAFVSSFQSYAAALDPVNQAVVNATSVQRVTVVDRTPTRQPTPAPSLAPSLQPSSPSLVAALNAPLSAASDSSMALAVGAALAALSLACALVWTLRRRWRLHKTQHYAGEMEEEQDDEEEQEEGGASLTTLPPPPPLSLGLSDDCTDDEEDEDSEGESVRVRVMRRSRRLVHMHALPQHPPPHFPAPLSLLSPPPAP